MGAGNDFTDLCSTASAGPDLAFKWSMDSDEYVGMLVGADWDSVITVQDDCGGEIVGCNDDSPYAEDEPALWSELWVYLEGGTEYVIIVDGVTGSDAGEFQLDILGVD